MDKEFIRQLRRLAIERRPEACLGCGFEHGCSTHGCAVIKKAIETIKTLNDFDKSQSKKLLERISVLEEQLAAHEKAEKDGLIVRLPCSQNATLYSPRKNDVLKQKVEDITVGDGDISVAVSFECDYECKGCPHYRPYTNYEAGDGGCDGEYGFGTFLIKDFGKTVFSTPEAAEAALKE